MKRKILLNVLLVIAMVATVGVFDIRAEEHSEIDNWMEAEMDPSINVETEENGIELFAVNKAINWNVKNNTLKMTSGFNKKKGSKVTINLLVNHVSGVKIGIVNNKSKIKRYTKATLTTKGTFTIPETSSYSVFVENTSGNSVKVQGWYRR
ncbi:MAG: hypothetical protein ACOX1S_10165 [Anaerostipes sp.]|jgi:hypothetical protein